MSLRFGDRSVLDRVTAVFEAPVVLVSGPSGGGKSSLLRLLNGLSAPDAGVISYKGRPLEVVAPTILRQQIGFVQQRSAMLTTSGYLELEIPRRYNDRAMDRAEAEQLAAALDLGSDRLNQVPQTLSVGEQQRLAIVRALAARPEVLLLDEPSSAQDAERAQQVHTLLASQVAAGLRLVVVEHKPEALSVYDAPQRYRLEEGRLQ